MGGCYRGPATHGGRPRPRARPARGPRPQARYRASTGSACFRP